MRGMITKRVDENVSMKEEIPVLALDLPLTRPNWRWFTDVEAPDFLDMTLEGLDSGERDEVISEFAKRRQGDPITRHFDSGSGIKGLTLAVARGEMSLTEGESLLAWFSTAKNFEDPNGSMVASFGLLLRERLAKWLPSLHREIGGAVVLVSPTFRFNGESMLLESGRPLVFVSEEAVAMIENVSFVVCRAIEANLTKDHELLDRCMRVFALHAAATSIHKPEIYSLAD
jgi:hypothetical protein